MELIYHESEFFLMLLYEIVTVGKRVTLRGKSIHHVSQLLLVFLGQLSRSFLLLNLCLKNIMEVKHFLSILLYLCLVLSDCLALDGGSVEQEGELLLVLWDESLAGDKLIALAAD